MANITKLNLYLNEEQYKKLCFVAEAENKSPEEVANNSVYGYLAIVDPFADEDREPPQDTTEVLFYISDDEAADLERKLELQGLDDFDLDSYARYVLLRDLHTLSEIEGKSNEGTSSDGVRSL